MRHTENKQVDTKVAKVLRRTFRGFLAKLARLKRTRFINDAAKYQEQLGQLHKEI